MHDDYRVYLGLDVGKDGHHAVALAPDGKRLHDAALINTEAKLRQVFDKLARHGQILVVVDQPVDRSAARSGRSGLRLQQRDHVAGEVEGMFDPHPLFPVLTSMPGIGVGTAARILLEVGDGSAFAGLARRRVDVLFAMLRDQKPYRSRPTEHALTA